MEESLYRLYSTVSKENVEWLWYPYIPYGKITLLLGDPGDGKSTCIIRLAACLSTGGVLPDGTKIGHPQTILYQCAEDNLNDTVKPRLEAAGADCGRIAYIEDNDESLSLNDWRIGKALESTGAKLLVLDPIQAFISRDTDMQNASKMRAVLGGIGRLAEKYGCAVVLVGHMTKSTGGKELYRGLGSIDIAAISRSVLMITRDWKIPQVRYLSQIKSSLAPAAGSFAFIMDNEAGFQWLGKINAAGSDGAAMEQFQKKSKLERATELLRLMLTDCDKPAADMIKKFSSLSVSERTVRTAAKELALESYRKKNKWFWHLPEAGPEERDG